MVLLNNRVGQLPSQRSAIFINHDKDIGYTIDTMMLHQIRHILCVDNDLELKGIISIMDILKTLYNSGSVDFLSKSVHDFMTKEVYTISQDESVRDAILLIKNMGLSGLPVMSDDNISGFFTVKDIISQDMDDIWERVPDKQIILDNNDIGRIITADDLITDDFTIWQAADRFNRVGRRSLIMTDGKDGSFKGVLTPSKLFTTLIPSFGKKFESGLLQTASLSQFDLTLNNFTTKSTSVVDIRRDMRTHNLEAIPLNINNRIVKLIGEKDLAGYLALHI